MPGYRTGLEKGERIIVHYFAAGATLSGAEMEGACHYASREYARRFAHVDPYGTCIECHDTHRLTVVYEDCSACHSQVETAEGLSGDVSGMTRP